MFRKRKRQRSEFSFQPDLGLQRFLEELERRNLSCVQTERLEIQPLNARDQDDYYGECGIEHDEKHNHHALALSMRLEGSFNRFRQRDSSLAISPESVS